MARLVPIPGIGLECYFPLVAGEKRPFDAETGWFGHFPTRTLTTENYVAYAEAGADWGLRCGTFSGLVVIDQDGAKGVALVRHLGLRSTCWAKTQRGRHDIHAVTPDQLAVLKTTVGLFEQVDLISTGAMVRAYALAKPIAPPLLTATRFRKLAERIKAKRGNGADTWEGADIEAGARNATLNATLYQVAVDNPDLELQHYKLVADGLRAHMTGGMPDREFKQTCASAWNAARTNREQPVEEMPAPLWGEAVTEYVAELPARVSMLGPFKTGQVGIMFAPPGIGKSLLLQFIADAIARGHGLGPWTGSGVERRALIVDGEMDARDVGERIKLLPAPNVLGYVFSERLPAAINLGSAEGQAQIMKWSDDVQFIAADTTSALLWPTEDQGDIWHPQVWLNTAPLRSWVRRTSRHLMWIDHANHANHLQGTKAKERDVDYVIKLTRPDASLPYLEMEMTWPKYRGLGGTDVKPTTWSLRDGQLVGRIDLTTKEKVARWRDNHPNGKQAECARDTGLKKQYVSRYW